MRPPEAEERELGGRDAWLAVIVATVVFFLVVIDVSAVNVAFPSIRDDFGVSESTLGWVISGYNVSLAALLLIAGRYADSFGRLSEVARLRQGEEHLELVDHAFNPSAPCFRITGTTISSSSIR